MDPMTLPTANDRKVLVIGWDAADWRVIEPMLAEDKMPNLKAFLEAGVRGNNATLEPALSPMLWTSIATGKRPYKTGIHGFSEPTPDGAGIRPITNTNRTCKAIWNMLQQCGKKSNIVAWWPSHPAEPIDGVMVSNWYQQARNLKNVELDAALGRPRAGEHGWTEEQWAMPPGTVHPNRLSKNLQEFRFHPAELTAEHIGPFVPDFSKIDQDKDKRLEGLAKTLADTVSVHAAATALMQLEPWDFMAVYYDGIDHFSHGFMKYHRTRQDFIKEADFEIYKDVVEGGYRFHDMMLGTLCQLAGEDTTVILLSDHGFHPDHLRPSSIPAEPAGPAVEHRPYGIFCMKGPGIRKGEVIHGANVLDLCPTVLALYGLPVGADMDGKPLINCFEEPPQIEVIPSWEAVEGDCGMHDPEVSLDSVQSAEAIKQLVELGYIDEPDEDTDTAVRETVRELHYNLARAYMDGGLFAEAVPLLERIWREWPEEHRFGLQLISARMALQDMPQRGRDIQTLAANIAEHRVKSMEAINDLREDAATYGIHLPTYEQGEDGRWKTIPAETAADDETEHPEAPRRFAHRLRQLHSRLGPFDTTLGWLTLTQALLSGDADTARGMLDAIDDSKETSPGVLNQIAACWMELGEPEAAAERYRRALEHDSDNAAAHLGVARALLASGDAEAALDSALTATELEFSNPGGHLHVGKSLVALQEYDAARTALELCVRQAGGSIEARAALADLLEHHLGEQELAAEHRQAIKDIEARLAAGAAAPSLDMVQAEIAERRVRRPDLTQGDSAEPGKVVTIVSGLPRSGTSMMMQMLDRGGVEPFTDGEREADADNPKGYYEHAQATKLAKDASWIPEARGKAVKIVAQLLPALPTSEQYRVVFMDRDLREVIKSQDAMLERLGKSGGAISDTDMMKTLDAQVERIERIMANRPDIQCLFVDYADVLASPAEQARRINAFLGGALDEAAMVTAVDGTLQRQRAETSSSDS